MNKFRGLEGWACLGDTGIVSDKEESDSRVMRGKSAWRADSERIGEGCEDGEVGGRGGCEDGEVGGSGGCEDGEVGGSGGCEAGGSGCCAAGGSGGCEVEGCRGL